MEILALFMKTVLLRPYVFLFLCVFLLCAIQLLGWSRAWRFWVVSWATAFVCEFSSTRTGIPFGWYEYNGSTVGQELYLSNIPFMASLSFSYLLYAAYCVALCLLLPIDPASRPPRSSFRPLRFEPAVRTGWPVLLLTSFLFALIDMVIDPVALRGDRWFLGRLYDYADPGVHFGVPLTNYVGWLVVGLVSLSIYFALDRRLSSPLPYSSRSTTPRLLLGTGLYYAVLAFILGVAFAIGEWYLGISGLLMCLPLTVWVGLRLTGYLQPVDQTRWQSDLRLCIVRSDNHAEETSGLHHRGSHRDGRRLWLDGLSLVHDRLQRKDATSRLGSLHGAANPPPRDSDRTPR